MPPLRLRLYIAGPMTGHEDFNYPAFFTAADQLRAVGYQVINPADIGVHPGWTREDYLRVGLKRLIDHGQGVALLPLWERSGGAQVEAHVARQLGLPVLPLVVWLFRAQSPTKLHPTTVALQGAVINTWPVDATNAVLAGSVTALRPEGSCDSLAKATIVPRLRNAGE